MLLHKIMHVLNCHIKIVIFAMLDNFMTTFKPAFAHLTAMLCNRFENTGASAVGQQFFWRLFIVYFRIEMGSQWFVRKGSFFTKSHLHFPKSHCKMMFTKVGMGLAVALPGARAGVWVPFRRQWPRALSVSEAAGLIRLEPRLWAGMVVRIL